MRERLRTLVLDASGFEWKSVRDQTLLRGVLGLSERSRIPDMPGLRWMAPALRNRDYEALSYVVDWREALCAAPQLDARLCDINNLVDYFRCLRDIREYDLIVLLHSATGDSMTALNSALPWFRRRRGRLVMFVGNEHDLLAEKNRFIREAGVDVVCSQLCIESARWLYGEAGGTSVLAMPHALNPQLYRPVEGVERTIDVGFIGALYHRIVGDMERTNVIRHFHEHGARLGLATDIRITGTIKRADWHRFLTTCKAIVGAESGTYYLERDAAGVRRAIAYIAKHPDSPFEEAFAHAYGPVREHAFGKVISSRHFEPIGTKTCQILLEGRYNDILRADEHYISVKKDLSNVEEAVARLKDEPLRQAMAQRTYEYVMDEHTYSHRVRALLRHLGAAA